MAKSSVTNPRCPGRRQFLRTAAGGAAGLASILALRQPPAYAQTRELTFLSIASFVPETDKELKRQFEEWGAKNKVKVRLDIIAGLQLQTKKAAEVQARSGHDLGQRVVDDARAAAGLVHGRDAESREGGVVGHSASCTTGISRMNASA